MIFKKKSEGGYQVIFLAFFYYAANLFELILFCKVFKKLGDAGLMGVTKPVEYGGLGLDFSYSVAFNEALGHVDCGAIPMSVAVQTDMSTPALAK